MSIKVTNKYAQFLIAQGRSPASATMDDVRAYRKMPPAPDMDAIKRHNAAIEARKKAKKENKNA